MSDTTVTPRWGEAASHSVKLLRLFWHAAPIPRGFDLDALKERMQGPGVYAFEGCHDGHPLGAILYIGQSGKSGSNETIARRLRGSLHHVGFNPSGEAEGWRPWAECWQLVLRWAFVDPARVTEVESLLIRAHCPPFNSQELRGTRDGDLVLLNCEEKGRFLPVVASHYFHSAGWPMAEFVDG